jgi:hypothetical protein
MSVPPPLRFLLVVVGGWVTMRAAMLAPAWQEAAIRVPPAKASAEVPAPTAVGIPLAESGAAIAYPEAVRFDRPLRRKSARLSVAAPSPARLPPAGTLPGPLAAASLPDGAPASSFPAPPPAGSRAAPRWSFSVWAFARPGGAAPLAPGATLGGSQLAGRLRYRLNGSTALSGRFYLPARQASAAEAAFGGEWRPSAGLPVRLLAERRQALGRRGRSAFALTAFGGVSELPVAGFRLDAFAQAGIVGTRRRDLFAEGALRLSRRVAGPLRAGAGAWAAAQPGVARLDLGPQAVLRLAPGLTLAADWRFRVAGNAAPGSGPAITLSTDF